MEKMLILVEKSYLNFFQSFNLNKQYTKMKEQGRFKEVDFLVKKSLFCKYPFSK